MFKLFVKISSVFFILTLCAFLHPIRSLAQTILFQDNFDDGNIDDWQIKRSMQWSNSSQPCTYQGSPNIWIPENGGLSSKLDGPACVTEIIPNNISIPANAEYSFQVDITMTNSTSMDRNFIFKYQDSNNWFDIHTFQNMVNVQKVVNGVGQNWSFSYVFTANISYRFNVEVYNDKIKVLINDALVGTVLTNTTDFLNSKAGLQASSGGGYPTALTWFDNVLVTQLSGPTSTPSATPTASPSATPTATATPSAIPVSKVVFIPGFGASWNADAILNCKTSGYSGDWTLASYAENVYNNILTLLPDSGWNTKPFYYDWRRDVRTNANILTNFINTNTEPNEKVDIVGHSMGGLVGRAYLEAQQGQKLDSLLTIGSPHRGVPVAYPAWSAGRIWDDNFITKIAATIILKRCEGLFSNNRQAVRNQIPSIHNLLPTTNYLRDVDTGLMKPVSNMLVKNNWLPNTLFSNPFWGVRVGTLSGTGFPTLRVIRVDDPSDYDIAHNNWLDGKPVSKVFNTLGDGTVLTQSSQIPGASINQVINQDHEGLVSSVQGMSEILKFINRTQATTFRESFDSSEFLDVSATTSTTSNISALVIIGYPGNFWVTKDGVITKDKEGMVSYINPTSGSYQLSLIPQTSNTLFIVAQFLSDGQVLYKEYNLTGLLPKSNTLNFSLQSPTEDIVN